MGLLLCEWFFIENGIPDVGFDHFLHVFLFKIHAIYHARWCVTGKSMWINTIKMNVIWPCVACNVHFFFCTDLFSHFSLSFIFSIFISFRNVSTILSVLFFYFKHFLNIFFLITLLNPLTISCKHRINTNHFYFDQRTHFHCCLFSPSSDDLLSFSAWTFFVGEIANKCVLKVDRNICMNHLLQIDFGSYNF